MRRIFVLLFTLQIFVSPVVVYAEEVTVTARNQQTGADSVNTAEARVSRRIEIVNQNSASVENNIIQNATTGGNTVAKTNGDTTMETGAIAQEVTVTNDLNHNRTTIKGTTSGEINAENTQTGANSTNSAAANASEEIAVSNKNTAEITNTETATLNTGFNQAEEINGKTKIKTGKIEFVSEVKNEPVNTNDTQVHAESGNIGVRADNTQTQSNSTNIAQAAYEQVLDFAHTDENFLKIDNKLNVWANTGGNTCQEVNGRCEIVTGDITGKITVGNKGNANDKDIEPTPTPTVPLPTLPPSGAQEPTLTVPLPPLPPSGAQEPTPTVPLPPLPPSGAQEPTVTPTPEVSEEPEDEEEPLEEKIKELIKKFVPKVKAAEAEQVPASEGQVIAAVVLPVTGIGYNGIGMGLSDIAFGLSLIFGGLFIRRGTSERKSVC